MVAKLPPLSQLEETAPQTNSIHSVLAHPCQNRPALLHAVGRRMAVNSSCLIRLIPHGASGVVQAISTC